MHLWLSGMEPPPGFQRPPGVWLANLADSLCGIGSPVSRPGLLAGEPRGFALRRRLHHFSGQSPSGSKLWIRLRRRPARSRVGLLGGQLDVGESG